jgi:hypothetical protein
VTRQASVLSSAPTIGGTTAWPLVSTVTTDEFILSITAVVKCDYQLFS